MSISPIPSLSSTPTQNKTGEKSFSPLSYERAYASCLPIVGIFFAIFNVIETRKEWETLRETNPLYTPKIEWDTEKVASARNAKNLRLSLQKKGQFYASCETAGNQLSILTILALTTLGITNRYHLAVGICSYGVLAGFSAYRKLLLTRFEERNAEYEKLLKFIEDFIELNNVYEKEISDFDEKDALSAKKQTRPSNFIPIEWKNLFEGWNNHTHQITTQDFPKMLGELQNINTKVEATEVLKELLNHTFLITKFT